MGNENHTVIVYFSKDGNTRSGAMRLNERLGGRIIELREQKKGQLPAGAF
jgi:flavodoxin